MLILGQCLWCCHHDKVTARVQPVHLMNVQMAAECRPSDEVVPAAIVHTPHTQFSHPHDQCQLHSVASVLYIKILSQTFTKH